MSCFHIMQTGSAIHAETHFSDSTQRRTQNIRIPNGEKLTLSLKTAHFLHETIHDYLKLLKKIRIILQPFRPVFMTLESSWVWMLVSPSEASAISFTDFLYQTFTIFAIPLDFYDLSNVLKLFVSIFGMSQDFSTMFRIFQCIPSLWSFNIPIFFGLEDLLKFYFFNYETLNLLLLTVDTSE